MVESFELESLRDSDVGKLFLGTAGLGAGSTVYPSRVGTPVGVGVEEMATSTGQRTADCLGNFIARGEDPLKPVVDYANGMGLEVYLRKIPVSVHGVLGRRYGVVHSMAPCHGMPQRTSRFRRPPDTV